MFKIKIMPTEKLQLFRKISVFFLKICFFDNVKPLVALTSSGSAGACWPKSKQTRACIAENRQLW